MKRGHTVLEYKAKIRAARIRPDIAVERLHRRLPGETERDFEATMKLIEEVGFDTSFSFVYSARPGTPAADLPDDTDEETKKQRLHDAPGAHQPAGQEISRRMVGSTQRILVTGRRARIRGSSQGRTENNRVVNFPVRTAT
jgi:tRNA-2-methylthio-N6-dimethylallyladenosine synthase